MIPFDGVLAIRGEISEGKSILTGGCLKCANASASVLLECPELSVGETRAVCG